MKCPFCGLSDSQVIESRLVNKDESIRRRRECNHCQKRFTTYEKVRDNFLWVVKKDGRREPFDKEKIKRGVIRAAEKRPISLDLVNDVVDQVEREMLKKKHEEVSSKAIGRAVIKRLKKIDKVAWLRFASVYLEFDELEDFAKAMKDRRSGESLARRKGKIDEKK